MEFKIGDKVRFKAAFAEGNATQKAHIPTYKGRVRAIEGPVVFVSWGNNAPSDKGVHFNSLELEAEVMVQESIIQN